MSWFTKNSIESEKIELKGNLERMESFKGTNLESKYAARAAENEAKLSALYLKEELEKNR